MGKDKKPKIPVTDYLMSVHAGICWGPVDALLAIYTGEKLAWSGEAVEEQDIYIDNRELYGGPTKEGGVQGIAHYLPGNVNQVLSDAIAHRFGLTGATMPAFRGVSTIFFHGDINDTAATPTVRRAIGRSFTQAAAAPPAPNGVKGAPGFYWQSQNPTLKTIWAKIRRRAVGLDDSISLIADPTQETSNSVDVINLDANPAHIIYEALTNADWGMGGTSTMINVPSFTAAAQTLFDESFGLSMLWTQQSTIEDFVGEVLDHIQATLYVNPRDGLLTIKLLRDDYDVDTIPLFTPDNCTIDKLARKGEGEIINEITVTWTNPSNEGEETVSVQNLAGIVAAGGVVADSRNYYAVRNINLAMKLANRDIRSASAPLAKTEMVVSRVGWTLTPGAVLKIVYPEHGLNETVFRVGNIKYGKPGDVQIVVTISEDVFGLDPGDYVIPNSTAWRDPSRHPSAMSPTKVFTLPFYLANQIVDLSDPEVVAAILGATTNADAYGFDLLTETSQPDGSLSYDLSGFKNVSGTALLEVALDAETQTTFEAPENFFLDSTPVVGGFVVIGDPESESEIAFIRSMMEDSNSLATTTFVLDRGVMDTVPRDWPVGTRVWYLDPTSVQYDDTLHSAGETVNFKLLTRTSLGRLDETEADIVSYTMTDRPYLPLRPADVKVEGVGFTPTAADAVNLVDDSNSAGAFMDVTWARRNRDTEDAVLLKWTDADVAPPAGVTTTVSVLSLDGLTVWATNDALAGTAYSLAFADFDGPIGRVKVTAKDADANESLQGHEILVRVRPGGYGLSYGLNYSGV